MLTPCLCLSGAFAGLCAVGQVYAPYGGVFEGAVICRRALLMSTDSSESSAADAGPSRDLSKQGGVVAGMTLASRISGFVRDVVLSNFFGATGVADAFFVAFRIPNFFRRLFAEGAFSQAFVPVASGYVERGDRAALVRFVKVMGGDFALLLTIISVLGVFAADWLIALFAPGFWNDDGRLTLAGDMLRVTFPYLGFISLTAFAAGLLNSHHHYAVPAFTPVLLNLCLIAAALWGTPLFAEPVMALAWGVLVAGIVQWLFQLPALARIELLVTPVINWQHEGVRRVGKLMLPAVFAASVSQINALVGTILASLLVTGSISWLYYSDRLLELPIGLVAIAIGTVLLPNLSRLHAAGSTEQFSRSLEWGMRMGALFGAPAAAALYLLALPLITTIFFHGAMTRLDPSQRGILASATRDARPGPGRDVELEQGRIRRYSRRPGLVSRGLATHGFWSDRLGTSAPRANPGGQTRQCAPCVPHHQAFPAGCPGFWQPLASGDGQEAFASIGPIRRLAGLVDPGAAPGGVCRRERPPRGSPGARGPRRGIRRCGPGQGPGEGDRANPRDRPRAAGEGLRRRRHRGRRRDDPRRDTEPAPGRGARGPVRRRGRVPAPRVHRRIVP